MTQCPAQVSNTCAFTKSPQDNDPTPPRALCAPASTALDRLVLKMLSLTSISFGLNAGATPRAAWRAPSAHMQVAAPEAGKLKMDLTEPVFPAVCERTDST
jgi:hypothetical protein